jgi:hypothetical protein
MRPRLIGLIGYAGSGKTTVSSILCTDFQFQRLRFADTLKRMLLAFGLTPEQVDGCKKEFPCDLLNGGTPRWAMQTLGTEWGRNLIHPDIWVNVAIENWRKRDIGNYVFDDVRFENEAHAIREAGGEIWRVRRPGYAEGSTHASEQIQEKIVADWGVNNVGDLDHLWKLIHAVMRSAIA